MTCPLATAELWALLAVLVAVGLLVAAAAWSAWRTARAQSAAEVATVQAREAVDDARAIEEFAAARGEARDRIAARLAEIRALPIGDPRRVRLLLGLYYAAARDKTAPTDPPAAT